MGSLLVWVILEKNILQTDFEGKKILEGNTLPNLRKHPFLLALRRWGRFARDVPPRETSPAAKSEEKRMFSQANTCRDGFVCKGKNPITKGFVKKNSCPNQIIHIPRQKSKLSAPKQNQVRFRRRTFHEPNLIRIKADQTLILIAFRSNCLHIRYTDLCIRFGTWKVRRLNQSRSIVAPEAKFPAGLGEKNGWAVPNWNRRS